MATNISHILMQKSKFFETFLNDLQTVSIKYRKRLKKVGILRVNLDSKQPYFNSAYVVRVPIFSFTTVLIQNKTLGVNLPF